VGAQVEYGAAARGDAQLALPVGGGGGTVSVKMGVELNDAAEDIVLDEVLDGQKVRVPPAVLVDADEALVLFGDGNELVGLGGGGNEWLLRQDVLAGLEHGLCEFEMVVGRGRDDDDFNVRVCQELLDVCVVLGLGVVVRRRVAVFGAALDNAVELELRRRGDEGDVEDFGGHAAMALASSVSGAGVQTHP